MRQGTIQLVVGGVVFTVVKRHRRGNGRLCRSRTISCGIIVACVIGVISRCPLGRLIRRRHLGNGRSSRGWRLITQCTRYATHAVFAALLGITSLAATDRHFVGAVLGLELLGG